MSATIIFDEEYGGNPVGRIKSNGIIYNDDYGGEPVGRAEGVFKYKAGAAYILLLK